MLSVHALLQEARVAPRDRRRSSGDRKLERRLVAEGIDRLPEQPRLVLGLRYYEAIRPRDIAKVLGLEEDEVRRLLAEAVGSVADYIKEQASKGAVETETVQRPRRARGRAQ